MAESGKEQLVDRAVRELRARILSGEFRPDQHISEAAAGELLNISRTPAREALAQLVDEGLMVRSGSGRCTVRLFTRDDVMDAMELRGVLEGTVLRRAAERGAAPEVLRHCEGLICQIDTVLRDSPETLEFERYASLNDRFHRQLARISGSGTMERELLRAIRLPFATPNAFPAELYDKPRVRRSFIRAQEQHRAILDAVRRGEGTRAEALAREHARLAWEDYHAVMYDGQDSVDAAPAFAMIAGESTPAESSRLKQGGHQ
ncbi:GntR family transcriptional regulator [Psychromarinibacter sp. C21-152]|uniref:GntR family transcriptional regulator n=1 Tax=Psychromarinibacter sediminicola TaxID=3033385 RepID=A0AAE3NK83_9RHOB|nr:GntR family transcriptional regulator [Psychromarinibacter sediminicola]MDF0599403.1 GntR family transcriptional regulator [Psychromarinibacter sediminicola]